MKVKELYEAVALLGFETDIDEEATFFPALNTALHDVKRIVPTRKKVLWAHLPPDTLVADTERVIHSGEGIIYKTEGAKSLYIEISGTGVISIADTKRPLSSSVDINFPSVDAGQGYEVIKRILKHSTGEFFESLELSIKASTLCKVRALAIYGEITSADEEDIPSPDKYVRYDLEKIAPDFASLAEQPKWEGGNTLSDYYIEGKYLFIPRNHAGDIELTYIPKIHNYTIDDTEKDIDISDEYIGALKLLIASYVWLDDDASRAQYYKSLYNEEISLIAKYHRDLNVTRYESVNNW